LFSFSQDPPGDSFYSATVAGGLNGTIDTNNIDNEFFLFRDSWLSVAWQVVVATPSLVMMVFALIRLAQFFVFHGSTINLSKVILSLEVVENFLRVLFAVGDPQGLRSFYPAFWQAFFLGSSLPFSVATTVLIQFHWNSCIHSFGAKSLDWMLKPVIGLIVLTILGEFIISGLRAAEIIGPIIVYIYQAFYALIEYVVIGYIIFTVKKLFDALEGQKELNSTRFRLRDQAVRMAKYLVAIAVILFLFTGLTFAIGLVRTVETEFGFLLALFIALPMISLAKVLIFRPARKKEVEHSASTDKSGSSSTHS